VPAQLADVPITIEILPEAQRMVDEANERWLAEHGFLADNPLLDEILRASDLLRTHPQIGVIVRRGRSGIRRLLLHSGWHLYYPVPRRSAARRDPRRLVRQPWQQSSAVAACV
jgi:hypothetical protein